MPASPKIRAFQLPATLDTRCSDAAEILDRAHQSAAALLKARNVARQLRGGKRGISTDEEQDLLRAMLVMAAAGLDAVMKQLIRDTVPSLVSTVDDARAGFEKFVARQVARIAQDAEATRNRAAAFLAQTLTNAAPWQFLMSEYLAELTSGSLQSTDELRKIASALGLTVRIDDATLRPIFEARNQILHELDINLERDRRRRNHRALQATVRDANQLLHLAESVLVEVERKLK